jgi:general L-amino acid transport system permease protein
MWGGPIWTPLLVAAGPALGFVAFRFVARAAGTLAGVIAAGLVPILWWLLAVGPVAGAIQSVVPLGIELVESRLFGGFMLSVWIGVVAIAISLVLGVVLALGRQSDLMIVKYLSVGFIEFIRGVPLITLLFVASTLLNIFMPPGTNFDIILRVMIMATLFASAYIAEVVRGGLAALPRGQYEAADALGLDYWKAQRLVILPQALKISIPGIVSTFIGLFKDTTLVSIIGLLDPIGLTGSIRADANWNGIVWELYGFIALLFFLSCFSMSRYSMWLEKKLRTEHR